MAPRSIWAFASGSNSPGKIVGTARAGIPPGVALLRWDGAWKWDCGDGTGATPAARSCWRALLSAARDTGVPVFVDTGAFAELGAPKEIPPRLWREVLARQLELAQALGPRAVVVLPDKVGNQAATLRRLRTHREEVRAILDAGALGIVALQGGRKPDAVFAAEVAQVLGRRDWIVGFPTVRARREPWEIRAALEEIPWSPRGAHLLGIGPAATRWPDYVAALRGLAPGAWASSDAVLHRRLVGRAHVDPRGRSYPTKPLTREQDIAKAELFEEAWGAVWDPSVGEMVDPTEQLPFPSDWMPQRVAKRIARDGVSQGVLLPQEGVAFAADPTAGRELVLARDEPGSEFWLDWQIEHEWWQAVGTLSSQMREVRARQALFGEAPPAPEAPPAYGQMELEES